MRLLKWIVLFAGCAVFGAEAQDTNIITLYTKLEAFEAQTERTLLKAWGNMGTVTTPTASISVSCKEVTDIATGAREYGVVIGIKSNGVQEFRSVIDYDEMESVLAAMDYITKVDLSMTSLPSFQAVYRTRSDLRFLAYNSTQRTAAVQALQIGSDSDVNRIPLATEQLAQFKLLMRAAKEKLDALKKSAM